MSFLFIEVHHVAPADESGGREATGLATRFDLESQWRAVQSQPGQPWQVTVPIAAVPLEDERLSRDVVIGADEQQLTRLVQRALQKHPGGDQSGGGR